MRDKNYYVALERKKYQMQFYSKYSVLAKLNNGDQQTDYLAIPPNAEFGNVIKVDTRLTPPPLLSVPVSSAVRSRVASNF